jgi:ubiquitin carboxyl-terminal hydrolase 6/32
MTKVISSFFQIIFQGNRVTYEQFVRWLEQNPDCLGICRWMLAPNTTLSLNNKVDTPTFYQTLSGVTHLEEQEIVELEKRFWTLSANSNQVTAMTHLFVCC